MASLNLDVNYFDHIKTKRLIGLLGKGAAELPLRIWAYCGKVHPKDAILAGYSTQEIEAIAEWWGKSGAMVNAMVRIGLLEEVDSGFKVHDWEDHEGHLITFHERAKTAAAKRWGRDATSIASSIAKSDPKQCPNQPALPTNQPKKKARDPSPKQFIKPTTQEVTAYAKTIGFELDGEHFVNHYEARGWKYGAGRPVVDWKAAVVTWKKNQGNFGPSLNSRPIATPAPKLPPPPPIPDIPADELVPMADVSALLKNLKGRRIPK